MMNSALQRFRFSALLIFFLIGSSWATAATANEELPVCQMIATGGTIAMKIDPVKNAPVPALSGEDLVAGVPELAKVAEVRVESPFNIPSYSMTRSAGWPSTNWS